MFFILNIIVLLDQNLLNGTPSPTHLRNAYLTATGSKTKLKRDEGAKINLAKTPDCLLLATTIDHINKISMNSNERLDPE